MLMLNCNTFLVETYCNRISMELVEECHCFPLYTRKWISKGTIYDNEHSAYSTLSHRRTQTDLSKTMDTYFQSSWFLKNVHKFICTSLFITYTFVLICVVDMLSNKNGILDDLVNFSGVAQMCFPLPIVHVHQIVHRVGQSVVGVVQYFLGHGVEQVTAFALVLFACRVTLLGRVQLVLGRSHKQPLGQGMYEYLAYPRWLRISC